MQGLELPTLVRDIGWTLKGTFKDRFDPKIGDEQGYRKGAEGDVSQSYPTRERLTGSSVV